jgi:hypothetical protein
MSLISRILAPSAVAEGASQLVKALSECYSPAQHHGKRSGQSASRKKGVQALLNEAANFRDAEKPGFLKRALLARALQQELLSIGYDINFVREVVPAVLAELTRPIAGAGVP